MSRWFRVLGLVVVLGMLAGCMNFSTDMISGSGRTTTRDFDLSGFTRVNISSAFQTEINRGDGYAVSVTVDDNVVEHLDVRVDGDTLRIGLKPRVGLGFGNVTLRATVTMPDLEGLNLSGASRANVAAFSSTKRVDVGVSGASRVNANLTSGEMRVEASGASTVEISGATGPLEAEASGASSVRLGNLTAQDAQVKASGASNITVNVSGRLTGDASGASNVRYTGNPTSVMVDTSGASNVTKQ
jgi:hypothetical protein